MAVITSDICEELYIDFNRHVDNALSSAGVGVCEWRSIRAYEEDEFGNRYTHVNVMSDATTDSEPLAFETLLGAMGAYLENLYKYIKHKSGILVWRHFPQIQKTDDGKFFVRSRLTFIPENTIVKQSVVVKRKK